MMNGSLSNRRWGPLTDLSDQERLQEMLERYTDLLALPEPQLMLRLKAMAEEEYALPDEKLKVMTRSRIAVWLEMDFEKAATLMTAYTAVMNQMPGAAAYRHVSLVQTIARELPLEKQQKLRTLAPHIMGGRSGIVDLISAAKSEESPVKPQAEESGKPSAPIKKRFWPFGRKKTA